MKFVERIKLGTGDSVVLYTATNHDGREFFAYIRCNKDAIRKMQMDYDSKRLVDDITLYGKVIYLDFKAGPDEVALGFLKQYVEEHK